MNSHYQIKQLPPLNRNELNENVIFDWQWAWRYLRELLFQNERDYSIENCSKLSNSQSSLTLLLLFNFITTRAIALPTYFHFFWSRFFNCLFVFISYISLLFSILFYNSYVNRFLSWLSCFLCFSLFSICFPSSSYSLLSYETVSISSILSFSLLFSMGISI